MAITIGHGTRVLFTDDSVTDTGRREVLDTAICDDDSRHAFVSTGAAS
ncbi:hypothetical protein [Labedella phragmitis]|nr:hypothetical protein [Labedella phragmitis]